MLANSFKSANSNRISHLLLTLQIWKGYRQIWKGNKSPSYNTRDMTKKELLELPAFRDAPEDANIMTEDYVGRWHFDVVLYDKEQNTIVII